MPRMDPGRLFAGRYGVDRMFYFLMVVALLFLALPRMWLLALLFAGWAVFRAFSRNIPRRQRELWLFNALWSRAAAFFRRYFAFVPRFGAKIARWWTTRRYEWANRKTHVFPRCPRCRSTLRLPRGRGTLMVTCPVCGHEFKQKT